MIPTVFGGIIAVVGMILLLKGSVPQMFAFMVFCSLMGGAAAFTLPALGGSSIPPVHFALGFLMLRLFLPGSGQRDLVMQAFKANLFLLIFVLYGVVMAYVGPRMFGNAIKVVPMKVIDVDIYAVYPLVPSSQNITATVYMVGTLLCAVGAYVACRTEGGDRALVKTGIVIACLHSFFGIASVVLAGTPFKVVLDFFKNANYEMLDQRAAGGFVRMAGIMPEASGFAAYGFAWFVFMAECWYRRVRPETTGPLALLLAMVLAASTSSTAYVSLAAYALIFMLRMVAVPEGVVSGKAVRVGLVVLALTTVISAVLIMLPSLAREAGSMLADATINKQGSHSSLQRAFWAQQGLKAFGASSGLGIGPGSFRSSSLATAILGATGLIGAASMVCYLLNVLKPLRLSTYNKVISETDSIGVAAAWAAFCILIPASVASATSDPGTDFATFAGASLALRLRVRKPGTPTLAARVSRDRTTEHPAIDESELNIFSLVIDDGDPGRTPRGRGV